MALVRDLLIFIAIVGGTIFSVAGVLGYLRFPDAYTRLHATGKVGVFGTVLLLVAAVLWTGAGIGRGLLLIVLLLLAGPTTSHAIATAAHRLGVPLKGSRDDLAAQQQTSRSTPDGETNI
jgi:multicomponent Na+:H+ antiporter subunit G